MFVNSIYLKFIRIYKFSALVRSFFENFRKGQIYSPYQIINCDDQQNKKNGCQLDATLPNITEVPYSIL